MEATNKAYGYAQYGSGRTGHSDEDSRVRWKIRVDEFFERECVAA